MKILIEDDKLLNNDNIIVKNCLIQITNNGKNIVIYPIVKKHIISFPIYEEFNLDNYIDINNVISLLNSDITKDKQGCFSYSYNTNKMRIFLKTLKDNTFVIYFKGLKYYIIKNQIINGDIYHVYIEDADGNKNKVENMPSISITPVIDIVKGYLDFIL